MDCILIAAALLIGVSLLRPARLPADGFPKSMSAQPVAEVIDIDGVINPASADFIDNAIARAVTVNANALVIELDTPGGLLTSAQTIVKALLNAPIAVIVYVAPPGASAASAGTFVTEAANIAAMAPGTTIGAAHPVEANGGDVKGEMGMKLENFTASWAKTIAEQRGRNQDWVEQAVRKSVSIGATEALKLHVVDLVAPDLPSLLRQASGRTVTVAGGRAIERAVEVYGPEKIVFGTDGTAFGMTWTQRAIDEARISDSDREAIRGANAAAAIARVRGAVATVS